MWVTLYQQAIVTSEPEISFVTRSGTVHVTTLRSTICLHISDQKYLLFTYSSGTVQVTYSDLPSHLRPKISFAQLQQWAVSSVTQYKPSIFFYIFCFVYLHVKIPVAFPRAGKQAATESRHPAFNGGSFAEFVPDVSSVGARCFVLFFLLHVCKTVVHAGPLLFSLINRLWYSTVYN